jgi:hypothetical protein
MEHPLSVLGIVVTVAIPALLSFTSVGRRVYTVRRGVAVLIWAIVAIVALLQIAALILADIVGQT